MGDTDVATRMVGIERARHVHRHAEVSEAMSSAFDERRQAIGNCGEADVSVASGYLFAGSSNTSFHGA